MRGQLQTECYFYNRIYRCSENVFLLQSILIKNETTIPTIPNYTYTLIIKILKILTDLHHCRDLLEQDKTRYYYNKLKTQLKFHFLLILSILDKKYVVHRRN